MLQAHRRASAGLDHTALGRERRVGERGLARGSAGFPVARKGGLGTLQRLCDQALHGIGIVHVPQAVGNLEASQGRCCNRAPTRACATSLRCDWAMSRWSIR